MNDDSHIDPKVDDLLFLLVEDALDKEGIDRVENWLSSEDGAKQYYLDFIKDYVAMKNEANSMIDLNEGAFPIHDAYDAELWSTLAEVEKVAESIPQEKEPDEEPIHVEERPRSGSKTSLFTVIFSAAALFFLVLFAYFIPAPANIEEVATVTDSIHAKWAEKNMSMQNGARLFDDGSLLLLREGLVKLQFDTKAHVVIEGPAEFQIIAEDRIGLRYGKVYAMVPPEATGFSVYTQNAKVVDLGTEFGILSYIDGNAELHLYKGKANVFAGEKDKRKKSQILTAGSAVKVDSHNSDIQNIKLDERAFVRNIDSKTNFVWKGQKGIRLADLLLGGNGFGTASRQNIEYDPATGAAVPSGTPGYNRGSGKITKIGQSPYLDSIFVPGSEEGKVIVSSAGHWFQECPTTSGLYYSNIICLKDCSFYDPVQQMFTESRQQYSDPGFLYFHSNIGLTVDLNAIRSTVAGLRVSSFSAFAGIVNLWDNSPDHSEVDVWVLVDGQLKSSRKALRADEGYDIHVDLSDTDRFLTLVVTDGGTVYQEGFPANHLDTCGFAEPVFEVALPQE